MYLEEQWGVRTSVAYMYKYSLYMPLITVEIFQTNHNGNLMNVSRKEWRNKWGGGGQVSFPLLERQHQKKPNV